MSQHPKTCQCCGTPLSRKRFPSGRLESNRAFQRRKYCCLACANTRRPEAQETRRQQAVKTKTTAEAAADPQATKTALQILEEAANDVTLDWNTRITAAKALAPYQSKRTGDAGKKEGKEEAAKKAATGRFAPAAAPKVVQLRNRN